MSTSWERLIEAVKASDLTTAMKRACVAQAILESARGTSRVASICRNFWGMKMRPELSSIATPMDVEVTSEPNGHAVFAAFNSEADALKGWRLFLTRAPYAGWEQYKDDAIAFIKHIGKQWCPSPGYVDKVTRLLGDANHYLEGKITSAPRWLLDPGHSDAHPGAISNDGTAKEERLNLLQSQTVASALAGSIICDIYNPQEDNLRDIGSMAEKYDGFISFHHNSYGGNGDPGTEVYCARHAKPESLAFAQKLVDAISAACGTQNRGVKQVDYTVIRVAEACCKGPVVLIESYFLNPYSAESAKKQSLRAAEAIASILSRTVH